MLGIRNVSRLVQQGANQAAKQAAQHTAKIHTNSTRKAAEITAKEVAGVAGATVIGTGLVCLGVKEIEKSLPVGTEYSIYLPDIKLDFVVPKKPEGPSQK